jgi:hypothetical protein
MLLVVITFVFVFCLNRLVSRVPGLCTGGEILMVARCRSSPNSKNFVIKLRQPFCHMFYLEFYLGGDCWAIELLLLRNLTK